MPLTAKGEKIKGAMEAEYGAGKGERVFYASKNAGTISGVDSAKVDALLTRVDAERDPKERAGGYNPEAVEKAIEQAERKGGKIGGKDRQMIHALLKGRHDAVARMDASVRGMVDACGRTDAAVTPESMRKAGARIARTGDPDPAKNRQTLEEYIRGMASDLQEAARFGYQNEMGRNSPNRRLDAAIGAMCDACGTGRSDASRHDAEHEMVVRFNGDFDMAGLIRHLHRLGSIGASRSVNAIDEDDKEVPFEWDGDGADKIVDCVLDGESVLGGRADASYKTGDREHSNGKSTTMASRNKDPDMRLITVQPGKTFRGKTHYQATDYWASSALAEYAVQQGDAKYK